MNGTVIALGIYLVGLVVLAVAFGNDAPGSVREIWQGFLDGLHLITGGRLRARRAAVRMAMRDIETGGWIDLGPVGALTCPNGPGCPHDLVQHRYDPARQHWECTDPHCLENPHFTYPTIGTEPSWADHRLLYRRSTG